MKQITIILLLLLPILKALACGCLSITVEEQIAVRDIVFAGTVISKRTVVFVREEYYEWVNDIALAKLIKGKGAAYEIVVNRWYKGGGTNDTLTVYTGLGHGDCGVMFEVGYKYIVYADRQSPYGKIVLYDDRKNTYWTSICMDTSLYDAIKHGEIENVLKK